MSSPLNIGFHALLEIFILVYADGTFSVKVPFTVDNMNNDYSLFLGIKLLHIWKYMLSLLQRYNNYHSAGSLFSKIIFEVVLSGLGLPVLLNLLR